MRPTGPRLGHGALDFEFQCSVYDLYNRGGVIDDQRIDDYISAIRDKYLRRYHDDPVAFHDKHISYHDDGDYCAFYNEYVRADDVSG